MTHFHQLWDLPPSPADAGAAEKEIKAADILSGASPREKGFIDAAGKVFLDPAATPYSTRALNYEGAMRKVAESNPHDVESQVFYALALVSNASPADREHRRQKQALAILQPLYAQHPDHPGIAHYLIHACDNQELAPQGLAAARRYASVAPSVPHALHMPSHIFTRLGLWQDSIQSNLAARQAAEHLGDTGEELHAMDYLVYAYLQSGRDQEAAEVISQLEAKKDLRMREFKQGYAATAMPIRYLVERGRWTEAAAVKDPSQDAQPQVMAITVWARGLGLARTGRSGEANHEAETLMQLQEKLRASGSHYWATQVGIMQHEVAAWSAEASGQPARAVAILRGAADDEDAVEKLPLTPGPIVPAREQLGQLLLEQHSLDLARKEFQTALINSPGRRGTLQGKAQAESAQ